MTSSILQEYQGNFTTRGSHRPILPFRPPIHMAHRRSRRGWCDEQVPGSKCAPFLKVTWFWCLHNLPSESLNQATKLYRSHLKTNVQLPPFNNSHWCSMVQLRFSERAAWTFAPRIGEILLFLYFDGENDDQPWDIMRCWVTLQDSSPTQPPLLSEPYRVPLSFPASWRVLQLPPADGCEMMWTQGI